MLAHTWLLTFTLNFNKLLTHLYGSISILLHSATGEIVHVLCISKRCLTSCYQSKVPVPDASKKHTHKQKKNLKTSEFEIWKHIYYQQGNNREEKMESLVRTQIHLKKLESSGFLFVKGSGRDCFLETPATIPLMISMIICNTKQKLLV